MFVASFRLPSIHTLQPPAEITPLPYPFPTGFCQDAVALIVFYMPL
jgi:hypothetical protein